MASIVVGIFKNTAKAQEAAGELLASGFKRDQISYFSPHVSDPGVDETKESIGEELRQEAGMDDFFRSLASSFADYDELTVYSDATRQGEVILSLYADSDEDVERAVELMDHHSPIDISEQYPPTGSISPWGSLEAAHIPEDVGRHIGRDGRGSGRNPRRAGNLLIYPGESGSSQNATNSG